MYRVRYYDQLIHPDSFKASGWRGALIVALNWVRWQIETFIQKQVLLFYIEKGELPKERKGSLLDTFRVDVQAERLQKEATSPLREPMPDLAQPSRGREGRYEEGTKSTALDAWAKEEGLPDRPKSLTNLIGMYAPNIRAKKYARGRRFLVMNPEGDFESLEDEDRGHSAASHLRGSQSGVGSNRRGDDVVEAR